MYTVSDFAARVGVTVHTLQRWDREGRLTAKRTVSNRRYYTEEDVAKALGIEQPVAHRKTIVYCRVSSPAQKADLINQRRVLETFCAARGISVDDWIEEVGGGMSMKRRKFLNLVDAVLAGEVGTVVLAHKDRLMRFGYPLMEHVCERMGCDLLVMNVEALSPEREMVEDLMTIVHCFSSRLYGLRNYRKSLKEALAHDTHPQDTASPNP
jgi:predicted site-specific integrase-resolvase